MDALPERQTLLTYLDDYLDRRNDKVFVQRRGLRIISYSYQQLALAARRTACELESRGVLQGERVILCGANSAQWVMAFWGSLLRGAVVVPLDEQSSPEFVLAVQKETEAKLVCGDSGLPALQHLNIPVINLDNFEETIAHRSDEPYLYENIDQNTLAEIVFTSGTTSSPKGVMLTHGNILANLLPLEKEIAKYAKWEKFVHPIRFLVLVPMSHVFGQFMGIFVPQLLVGEVHFENTLNPGDIVRRIRKSRISVLVLVPRMLRSLREWVERAIESQNSLADFKHMYEKAGTKGYLRRWLSFRSIHQQFGWKFWAFISGGATLDNETEEFWRRLGFAVLQGYGMTETASLVTVTHPFKRRKGSIGKPLPGYELKLDESGEISVRGPAVSPGYWSKTNGTQQRDEGWLHTGDLGIIDEQGHIFFKGREKDVIVTAAGVNIFPEDLEEALNRQPDVRASCVVAWTSEQGDEPLAVLIMRHEDAEAPAAIDKANASLAEHQKIRRWQVWPEPDFPRTPTEKILKREVLSRIREQGLEGRAKFRDGAHGASFILSTVAKISGETPGQVVPKSQLATDLKLDSLGRIELLSALEERYEIELDEAAFTAATTIGEVEKIVRGQTEQPRSPYPFVRWPLWFPIRWLRAVLFYLLILPITRLMSRMTVKGRDQLGDLKGPALFIANHVTLGDHAMILAGLPLRLRHNTAIAMEGERLRDWLYPSPDTHWFTRLRFLAQYFLVRTFFNVFPLPRHSGFRRSFTHAAECVDRGESVLVFPEGRRAPRGEMHMSSFKAGIGLLAKQLNVPVVPVKLKGLYELKRVRQYFAAPGTVSVVFGKPVIIDPMKPAEVIAEELQKQVEEL